MDFPLIDIPLEMLPTHLHAPLPLSQTMIIRPQLPPQIPPLRSCQTSSTEPHLNPKTNPSSRRNSNLLKGFTPLKPLFPSSLHLITNAGSDSGLLFCQKLLYLESLNINTSKVLEKNPNTHSASLESIKSVENCLCELGIQQSGIGRVLNMFPQLITRDVENDLYPVFGFLLNDFNIPFKDIRKAVIRCPRLLNCSVNDQLRLRFLRGLGFVSANAIVTQTIGPEMLKVSALKFEFGWLS